MAEFESIFGRHFQSPNMRGQLQYLYFSHFFTVLGSKTSINFE